MESMIDQRYRLELIRCHLDGFEEKTGKAVFFCPLCQAQRPSGKYVQKKGAMFWNHQWNAWRFNCVKCLPMTSLYRFLEKVNPGIANRYQRDRYASGTTGKGHDCPNPRDLALGALTGVSTGA